MNGIDFAENNANVVVRVGNSGSAASDVAISTDNGQTWHPAGASVPRYSGPNQMQSVAVSAGWDAVHRGALCGTRQPRLYHQQRRQLGDLQRPALGRDVGFRPGRVGDVLRDQWRFTGSGATKTQITTVSSATGVGFGMAASGLSHPAVFIIGTVGGQYGFFRSDDGGGASWTRINDDAHQYGWLQGNYTGGDENVFGRVYLTTGGRGYIHGN